MRLRRLRGPELGPQPQHDNEQLHRDYAYRAEAPDRQLLPVHLPEVWKAAFGDCPAWVHREQQADGGKGRHCCHHTHNGYLPSRVALADLTPPDNRPSHYYRRAAIARRYPRPAVSESVLWRLRTAALPFWTATTATLASVSFQRTCRA